MSAGIGCKRPTWTARRNDEAAVYISGDTVWYDGVAEIKNRFKIGCAVLFLGAARVPEVGPWHFDDDC